MIKFNFNFTIGKRQRIIITSCLLSLGLLLINFIPIIFWLRYAGVLMIITAIFSLWSLWQGISKLKAFILLVLPLLFTLAVIGSYPLIIPFWLRLFSPLLFGLVFYALLLSQNIFNVSSTRTIPLYRVATTISFVITIVTATLLFNDMFSLELFFTWNGLIAFIISCLLSLQLLWTVEMEKIDKIVLTYSFGIALVMAEIAVVLSFWPISSPLAAVVLGTSLFIMVGIVVDSFREKLGRGAVWQYLAVEALTFIIALLFTSWTR